MPISLPKSVTIPPDVLSRELEGEGVLLNLETEQYYVLDDVGMRMWQVLAERGDVEACIAQMLDEYDVDEVTLRQDLAKLIDQLAKDGLVTVSST